MHGLKSRTFITVGHRPTEGKKKYLDDLKGQTSFESPINQKIWQKLNPYMSVKVVELIRLSGLASVHRVVSGTRMWKR
jgi:hypothetical protein